MIIADTYVFRWPYSEGRVPQGRLPRYSQMLVAHKHKLFNHQLFQYFPQCNKEWKRIGPFGHHAGNLLAGEPRDSYTSEGRELAWKEANGNTPIIRDGFRQEGRIGYIHFRNVVGKVPRYREAFVDEGDIDMIEVLNILKRNNFDGVLIPGHTPQMACDAPWYAGMAYAMGYMKAALSLLGP